MRILVWFSVLLAILTSPSVARPPNIILIVADDLGYGDLGCYGNKHIKTPHLDRLAAEGVRFTQAYAGSTVCLPSRAVLMTGLHTGHVRQRTNSSSSMRPEEVSVAEVLKGAGYATGLIGKWALTSKLDEGAPTRQGFDVFYGYLGNMHAHNYYPTFLTRGESRDPLGNEGKENKSGAGVATKRVVYSNDAFADEAVKFVDQHKAKPFFLYLAFTVPHANNELGKATGDGMEVPGHGEYADKADWPSPRKGHAAMISRLDGYVGRLLEHLKKTGVDDDTLILFSSDNGPHSEGGYDPEMNDSNGPLRGHKRDLYEGGIRVPFIVRWPARVEPRQTSDHVAWFADVMPTFAELAGVAGSKLPKHDGVSVLPTLLGEKQKQPRHQYLYWEFYEQGGKQAVRAGDWKAVRTPMFTGKTELYDLKADVSETTDVASKHPDVVQKLEAMMQAAHVPPEEN